jgi:hypothetical protein
MRGRSCSRGSRRMARLDAGGAETENSAVLRVYEGIAVIYKRAGLKLERCTFDAN